MLRGVDSEACEQMFSVADRWLSALGHAHPITFELAILLYSDEHNDRSQCHAKLEAYMRAQSQSCSAPILARSIVAEPGAACGLTTAAKRRKTWSASCAQDALDACSQPAATKATTSFVAQPALPDAKEYSTQLHSASQATLGVTEVAINERRKVAHAVGVRVRDAVRMRCGWCPPCGTASVVPVVGLLGSEYISCGTCFGRRMPFTKPSDTVPVA